MRLKNLKTYYLKSCTVARNSEGGRFATFSSEPVPVQANIYDSKDGERVPKVGGVSNRKEKTMLLDMKYDLIYSADQKVEIFRFCDGNTMRTGDGVCVYASADQDPDYRIVSIREAGHLVCRLEKM